MLALEYYQSKQMEFLPFSEIRAVMEKAVRMGKNGEKIIHLELGRPDFDTPKIIKDACYQSIEKGNVFYTSNYGMPKLREAIAEKLWRDNKIKYDASEILVTVGLSEAVYCTLGSLLNPGDEVLIPNPTWLNYMHVIKYFGAVPVAYNLLEENDYQIDIKEIESKITDKTKMMVLITPNNPTGSVLKKEVLEEIADIAVKHDLLVVSDEIYEKLVYDGNEHVSIASIPNMKERTITLNGFSKAYSMTGWRVGYMAAPKEIIEVAVRLHQYATTCATSFVQEACIVALKHGEPYVKDMVREYNRRRDYVVNRINQIDGLSCKKPSGAFYIFVNIKSLGRTSSEIAEYLLEDAKLALVPGNAFGDAGEGYIRLSYANSYENLVEACDRLENSIKKLIK